MADEITFAPPDDEHFQLLLLRALKGQIPVYGVVHDTAAISFVRAHPTHRPELTHYGAEIVEGMNNRWQAGAPIQPWLYARDESYVVADDYFWLAFAEKYCPDWVAAQVLGEPIPQGLRQCVGPLPVEQIKRLLGFAE